MSSTEAARSDDVVERAEHESQRRRSLALEKYRHRLLVFENAVLAVQMLTNLDKVLKTKVSQHEDVKDWKNDIDVARRALYQSVADDDDFGILSVQTRVEQMTLTRDPLYLETQGQRKQEYLEQKMMKHEVRPNWVSNPSLRLKSLLKRDVEGNKEVTKDERHSCISYCAWSVVLLGMLVAIGFLIADFWSAQAYPSIRTNLVAEKSLDLPVLTWCSLVDGMPAFETFPTEQYPGYPLFGVRKYKNTVSGEMLTFPQTHDTLFTRTILGPKDDCKNIEYMSVEGMGSVFRYERGNSSKGECFSCFQLGREKTISLPDERNSTDNQGAINVELSLSGDILYCFRQGEYRNVVKGDRVRDKIRVHIEELVARGTIELNGTTSAGFAIDFGFDPYDRTGDIYAKHAQEAGVLCNLLLFSGYFYPVAPETDVRYRFDIDGGLDAWVQIGDGPYHPTPEHSAVTTRGVMSTEEKLQELSSRTGWKVDIFRGISMFAQDRLVSSLPTFSDQLPTITSDTRHLVLFEKSTEADVSTYTWSSMETATRDAMKFETFQYFETSIDFATFVNEIVTRRPATSVSEFVTDVFEYAGLFTGVCVYSLLVGPARMYLRRSKTTTAGQRRTE